jgi:alpha-beta hydrolase superfamily lysophospholipase
VSRLIAERRFALKRPDGNTLAAYRWQVNPIAKAVLIISHGMGEHARRYPPALLPLLDRGIYLYGIDHRGHGATLAFSERPPGDFGPGGFAAVVEDLKSLILLARKEHPRRPIILLGHSLGSFISQSFVIKYSELIDAAVLVGTSALDVVAASFTRETDINAVLNRSFRPARTHFDWLSSDESEVDAYLDDPLCGFSLVPDSMVSFFSQGAHLADPRALSQIRKDLPLYILVGERDPLVTEIGNLDLLIERYRAVGLRPTVARYPNGRHEILNETNRDEVLAELLEWLNSTILKTAAA